MKNFILSIALILLFQACTSLKQIQPEYIVLYKQNGVGEVLPDYLLLKDKIKSYEFFFPGLSLSVFGNYDIFDDTLYLYPRYEYTDIIKAINQK